MPMRRAHARSNLIKPVVISSDESIDDVKGTLVDVDAQGARIIVPLGFRFPDTVYLKLKAGGLRWASTVVWQRPGVIGVEFH